jgi:hypothetical protein
MHSPFSSPSSSPLPTTPSHLASILNERYATGLAGLFQNRHQHQPNNTSSTASSSNKTAATSTSTTSTITAAAFKALDGIRSELEEDLKESLFKIVLGPNIDHIQHGQFPDAFEAEERTRCDASDDVLHIVSGRNLLGVVREKKGLLEWEGIEQLHLQMHDDDIKAIEASNARKGDMKKEEEREREDAPRLDRHHHADSSSNFNQDTTRSETSSFRGRVLHLMMNYIDKSRATAIISPASSSSSVTIYDDQGNHWASTQQQSTHPCSPISSATKIINANNQHTHTMMHIKTPFVRTLTFISEHYNNNNQSSIKMKRNVPFKKRVVCRCTRATLPPSSMWLFTPRMPSHNVGGWYVEWVGDEKRGHPASLDPEVVVLLAAVETIKNESGEGGGGGGGASVISRLLRGIIG